MYMRTLRNSDRTCREQLVVLASARDVREQKPASYEYHVRFAFIPPSPLQQWRSTSVLVPDQCRASESLSVAVNGAHAEHTLRRGCRLPPPHGAPRVLKLYALKLASFQLPLDSISFVSSAWRLTRRTAYEVPLVTLKDFRTTYAQ